MTGPTSKLKRGGRRGGERKEEGDEVKVEVSGGEHFPINGNPARGKRTQNLQSTSSGQHGHTGLRPPSFNFSRRD